jgi:hypothetical protein
MTGLKQKNLKWQKERKEKEWKVKKRESKILRKERSELTTSHPVATISAVYLFDDFMFLFSSF